MKHIAATICLLISSALAAQVDPSPAAVPDSCCFNDEVLTTDDTGANSNYTRYTRFPERSYYVIYSVADHKTVAQSRPRVPERFTHRVPVDSNTRYVVYTKNKDGTVTASYPDSMTVNDYKALDAYLLSDSSFHYDTIFIRDWQVAYGKYPAEFQTKSICGYYYNQKNGWETEYYSVPELQQQVITGNHFREKCSGYWKVGKKHGKWFYYSPDGELQRIEKWRKGKLRKTKFPD